MSYEERGTWVYLIVPVVAYAAYVVVVLSRATDPITATAYQAPLLWSIGISIAASILLRIIVEFGTGVARSVHEAERSERSPGVAGSGAGAGTGTGAGSGSEPGLGDPQLAAAGSGGPTRRAAAEPYRVDDRDREIDRIATARTFLVLVAGALAALGMALAEWPHFWIANVIYLAFVLQAVSSAAVKLVVYRRGF